MDERPWFVHWHSGGRYTIERVPQPQDEALTTVPYDSFEAAYDAAQASLAEFPHDEREGQS